MKLVRKFLISALLVSATCATFLLLAYEFLWPSQYKSLATAVSWQRSLHDGSNRINVRLGPTLLSIPDNYFFVPPYKEAQPKGAVNHPDRIKFMLLVSANGFKPRSSENKADFPEPGIGKSLRISVSYNVYDHVKFELSQNRIDYLRSRKVEFNKQAGLKYYVFEPLRQKIFFEDGSLEDPKGVIECTEQFLQNSSDASREEGCSRAVYAGTNVNIDWTFDGDFLPEHKALDRLVMDGLNQFRIDGPPLQIVE